MEKLIIATYSFQRLICIPHPASSLLLNKELRLPTPACLVSPSSEQKAKQFSADFSFFQKGCCKLIYTEENITQHFRIFVNFLCQASVERLQDTHIRWMLCIWNLHLARNSWGYSRNERFQKEIMHSTPCPLLSSHGNWHVVGPWPHFYPCSWEVLKSQVT